MCSPDSESSATPSSSTHHELGYSLLRHRDFETIRRLEKLSRNPHYPGRMTIRRIARCILEDEETKI